MQGHKASYLGLALDLLMKSPDTEARLISPAPECPFAAYPGEALISYAYQGEILHCLDTVGRCCTRALSTGVLPSHRMREATEKERNVSGISTLAREEALFVFYAPTARAGDLMRLPKGPSRVKRIAHGVLGTPKVRETVNWFRHHLGFICSDDVYAGHKDNLIGSFNRCDRRDSRSAAARSCPVLHRLPASRARGALHRAAAVARSGV